MFTIIQWNCRGIRNKLTQLALMLSLHKPDVLCLQETLLGDRADPPQLKHYHSYRRYDGRGVAIYIHKSHPQTEVILNSTLEAVACRVKFGNAYLSVCSLYCPPQVPFDNDSFTSLFDTLPGNKLILGDFNAHHYQWGSMRTDGRGEQIANLLLHSNLCLLNDGSATRVDDRTGHTSCIDLSLSSPDIQTDITWGTIDDSMGSDHLPICISYSRDFAPAPPTIKFNCKKADWVAFSRIVDLDISGENIDDKVENLQTSILHAAEATIPKTSTVPNKHKVPWWTPGCRQVLNQRNRKYRIFDKQPTDSNYLAYKKARAEARRFLRRAKRNAWRSFVSTVNRTTPLKEVWSTINVLNNKYTRSPITTLRVAGNIIDDPVDIANTVASHFSEVSSSANYDPRFLDHKRDAELQPLDFAIEDVNSSYNSEFTMDELLLALKSCKGSSPGPSNITYGMIQHLNQSSLIKLLALYNEIWTSGTFPNSWHFAHVIPIPKRPGHLTDPNLFRPIALTECLCKVLERMVNKRLLFVLESMGVLNDRQNGFRPHRSTLDHLMHLEHCISEAFATKGFMVGVFLDIQKAYDRTWKHGILMKLHAYGLRGNLPVFIQNFLADRTFSVRLRHNVISDIFVQENGVPQGSVLSPTLFCIMINDILSSAPVPRNLKYSLYADDCAIWHSSCNVQFSAGRIQEALDSVHRWALQWGFKFSVEKCIGVVFTRKLNIPNFQLTFDGQPIPFQNSVRFLGLHFDRRLNWKVHVNQLLVKCNKALNILKYLSGTYWGADRKSLLMVYKSLIRSKIDYGSQVYGSASDAVLQKLNVFQNECLRKCLGALRCTRVERLEVEANVPPLRIRRDQMLLSYGISTYRKRSIDLPAAGILMQYEHMLHGAYRPVAVRLHFLCRTLGFDLSNVDQLVIKQIAPWETPNFSVNTSWLPSSKSKAPEAEVRQLFRLVLIRHLQSVHLYTDGSKTDECVGASVWSFDCALRYRLPTHTSVFTSELFAIERAIDFAINSPDDNFVIFSDSKSALQAINSLKTDSNEILGRIVNKLHASVKSFSLVWVPGHCSIYGNEQADELAKSAVELEGTWDVPRDLLSSLSLGKKSIMNLLWQSQWTDLDINTIKPVLGDWPTAHRPCRREEVVLARLRLNSTLLTHMKPYIDKSYPPRCGVCDTNLTISHILLSCGDYAWERSFLADYCRTYGLPFTLDTILGDGDPGVTDKLMAFLKETRLISEL